MPNGGHGDLFRIRERDNGWEVVFLDPHPRAKQRERVLARTRDVAPAFAFQAGATAGYGDPDITAFGDGDYRAGHDVGRELAAEEGRPGAAASG